jgi:hypothetical protein
MDDPFGGSTDLYHDDSAAERRHLFNVQVYLYSCPSSPIQENMSFYHGKNCNGLVFKFLKIKCPEYS